MLHLRRSSLAAIALCVVPLAASAQSTLPPCPWFGAKNNCIAETTIQGRPYKGEFRNDKLHGFGTLGRDGETKYVGMFKDNVYDGQGILVLAGGWRYEGEFKAGQFSGSGTLHLPDGRTYTGEFARDNFNGQGTLSFPDGRKYVGQFSDDNFHGTGTEYRADGSVLRAGTWDRDKFVDAPPAPVVAPAPVAAPAPVVALAPDGAKPTDAQRQQASAAPVPGAAPSPRLKTRALVIGNGAYTHFGRLGNARNDATAMATKLQGFGIAVDLVLDADRDTLVKALNDYATRATGQDVNILFYAGHGLQIDGVNYLIPTNMRADGISAGYVKLNGIALNAVMDYMPASTRLVFLDACRDNPASRSLVASRSTGSVGLAPVAAATGTLIAYATKEGAVAADGDGANSPYTTALLRHLDAPLDISLVLRRVRQTVLQMTSNTQEPWEYGSLVGEQLVLSQMAR